MARQGTYAKGAARREEILVATKQILASDGYRNLSLRHIARALGVEPAHILYYFDSREELLQKVIERWDEDNTEDSAAFEADHALDSFVEAITHNLEIPGIVHLYLIFAAEAVHPDHAAHEYFQQRFRSVHRLLVGAIQSEQATGRIAERVDADVEARKLIALADGLQLQALVDPSFDPAAVLAASIAELRGVPAAAPAA